MYTLVNILYFHRSFLRVQCITPFSFPTPLPISVPTLCLSSLLPSFYPNAPPNSLHLPSHLHPTFSPITYLFFIDLQTLRRASLEPPSKEHVSWETYIQADPGHFPSLGRTLICKESSKSFKATVAMVSHEYMDVVCACDEFNCMCLC